MIRKRKNIFNMNPMKFKPIKLHFSMDSDNDRVKDMFDCQPFNPRRHRIYPNEMQEERIKGLPIYVQERGSGPFHVLSKEAKQYTPHARTEMLSTIKHYPTFLGDIERAQNVGLVGEEWKYVHSREQYRPIEPAMNLREQFSRETRKRDEEHERFKQMNPFTPFVEKYHGKREEQISDYGAQYEGYEREQQPMHFMETQYHPVSLSKYYYIGNEKYEFDMPTLIAVDSQAHQILKFIDKEEPCTRRKIKQFIDVNLSVVDAIVYYLSKLNLAVAFGEPTDYLVEVTDNGQRALASLESGKEWKVK